MSEASSRISCMFAFGRRRGDELFIIASAEQTYFRRELRSSLSLLAVTPATDTQTSAGGPLSLARGIICEVKLVSGICGRIFLPLCPLRRTILCWPCWLIIEADFEKPQPPYVELAVPSLG
jgi:hypothetical protein